jgi:hypothetical protein
MLIMTVMVCQGLRHFGNPYLLEIIPPTVVVLAFGRPIVLGPDLKPNMFLHVFQPIFYQSDTSMFSV